MPRAQFVHQSRAIRKTADIPNPKKLSDPWAWIRVTSKYVKYPPKESLHEYFFDRWTTSTSQIWITLTHIPTKSNVHIVIDRKGGLFDKP